MVVTRGSRPPFRRHLKFLLVFFVVLLAASAIGNRGLMRLYQLHRDRAELEREIDRLVTANSALTEEVRGLKTDPGRVEAIAREELGLVKPGDVVYEFRTPPRPAAPPAAR